jgi:hypothetical protein
VRERSLRRSERQRDHSEGNGPSHDHPPLGNRGEAYDRC